MLPVLVESLSEYFGLGVLAFILVFVRLGAAFMIMPGIGDSFVSARVRLIMSLTISFMLLPVLLQFMPSDIPQGMALMTLIVSEFIIGLFFGTIARAFMTAMDTAGMVISLQSGLGNAQLFNPSLAQQGSLVGAFLSVTGVVFLMATNFHHILFAGVVETYHLFPVGGFPETGSMAELMSKAVASSFLIGVKIAAPFLVLTMLLYVGMGVIARLMPQIQVFLLALPLQILMAVTLMASILGFGLTLWLQKFDDAMVYFLTL